MREQEIRAAFAGHVLCWYEGVAKMEGESLGTVCAPDHEQQTVLSYEELHELASGAKL